MSRLELEIENNLIEELSTEKSQWTFRDDLRTEEQLWANFRKILESHNQDKLNDIPLSDTEFERVKNALNFSSFYDAAIALSGENGVFRITIQRDIDNVKEGESPNIQLMVIDHSNIGGGTSVYEIIHQFQSFKEDEHSSDITQRNRRFDVSLLINGLPLIHIELKTGRNPYMEAFNQIQKYIKEGKFKGIYSMVQMFVVSNEYETKYYASAQDDELNPKFISGWVDTTNKLVNGYLDFARTVLKIPMAHRMISQYSVLDSEKRRINILRPYQIHAIEEIRKAYADNRSGYIWHTTGSGKTMTSYKAARNLLLDKANISKTMFLIDRKDLDNQTSDDFRSYASNDVVDVNSTDNTDELLKRLLSSKREMIVTTIQKLQNLIRRFDPKSPYAIPLSKIQKLQQLRLAFVVDECHRTVTPETKRVIEEAFSNTLWYGFTGTPRFADKLGLDGNPYEVHGDYVRTTDGLYGPLGLTADKEAGVKSCLHRYTIKEAIHDQAVLGFKVENLGPSNSQVKDGEDVNEDQSQYDTEKHRLEVLNVILNKCNQNWGIANGANKTYSAILTVPSIHDAILYYKLLKKVKDGKTDLKINEVIQKVLPDFPKFAITYSLTENKLAQATNNQVAINENEEGITEALKDYERMFHKSLTRAEITAYNEDLNKRLKRKSAQYKIRDNQLDLVIVVDRLLTGFDAPCMSMLFIDRPPMKVHNLIQAFSRTNRLFDARKTVGNIYTFRSPHTFAKRIKEALILFSGEQLSGDKPYELPTWDQTVIKFKDALAYLREIAPTPNDVPTLALEQKKLFVKAFQKYDSCKYQLTGFSNFCGKTLDDFGISEAESEQYYAMYQNAKEDIKVSGGNGGGTGPVNPPIEPDQDLVSFGSFTINYSYIIKLIQELCSNDNEEFRKQLMKQIGDYIEELSARTPKIGQLLNDLWLKIKADPEKYKHEKISAIFEDMKNQAKQKLIDDFCEQWYLDDPNVKKTVFYSANDYKGGDVIPNLNEIHENCNFERYKQEAENPLKKFIFFGKLDKALKETFLNDIMPLKE